jgi:GntR family transcriptional regulator/MocR family aminotransferase
VKQATGALLPVLDGMAETSRGPLYRQLYDRVRAAILDGVLAPRHRLPSTRTLARDLGVSRLTVETAFTQLQAEGFLVRRVGAGSYVADVLPEHARRPRTGAMRARGSATRGPRSADVAPPTTPAPRRAQGSHALSARGRVIAAAAPAPEPRASRPFVPCMPALDAFPHAIWARLAARRARAGGVELLGYGEAAGYRPLREAIATYLGTARAVRCTWEQVVVLSSTQQALELAARLLLDPGDAVWLEEPGYLGARAAFAGAGARLVPVPVDAQGMDVDAGIAAAPDARLAYVTPSHQYPLGVTMSLARRLALLRWAERADAWIVEDDYDSEFRYTGRPIAAMQGMDATGRVLYVGTLNKALFPSLRLAYLVAPADLVDSVVGARAAVDGHPPVLSQATAADFVHEGHFAAHVRHMRALYQERRDALVAALAEEVGPALRVGPSDTGMHLTARLPRHVDDVALVRRALDRGLEPRALSRHYAGPAPESGLVLGYSGVAPSELRRAARVLAGLL